MHLTLPIWALFASYATCLASSLPFYNDAKFNQGQYGKYVTRKFLSNPDVLAPVLNFMKPFSACDDGSYLFITPRGNQVTVPRAVILDVNGSAVWTTTREYGNIYDLRVQQYKGKPHLTFWAGLDVVNGHGVGYHYVLDQNYQEVLRFTGARNAGADLHVFTITPQNSAIYIYYNQMLTDTSSVSSWRFRGWVYDCLLQEVDMESGEVLFKWSALDQLNFNESSEQLNAATLAEPWDPFHMNSIIKDSLGNYMIGFRHLNALVYVDGMTGAVLWQLGGKGNKFQDLSDGRATTFLAQHDAQWVIEGSTISIFDNQADWYTTIGEYSRGVLIKIDVQKMTAEVIQEFKNPIKFASKSQGSYQTLPNENVLLGFGFNAVLTEFSATGEVLCDAYFQPASTFGSGNVQSYRAMRFNWTAFPGTDPDLVFEKQARKLYVSWNGATEVRTWLFQATESDIKSEESTTDQKALFNTIGTVPKIGFETEFDLSEHLDVQRYVRVLALDSTGKQLGLSKTVDLGALSEQAGAYKGSSLSLEGQDVWKIGSLHGDGFSRFHYRIGVVLAFCAVLAILVRCGKRRLFLRRFVNRARPR